MRTSPIERTPILSKRMFNRIARFFPVSNARPRVDDRLLISGIIWVIKRGAHWRDMPEIYGKWSTAYQRFRRWAKHGIFDRIFAALRAKQGKHNVAQIDSTYVKVHRTAASMKSDGKPREIGMSRGGLTTKIHFLCNTEGAPLDFVITAGNVSDPKAAEIIIKKNWYRMKCLIGDKGYDSDALRDQLASNGVTPCIPGRGNRKKPVSYDRELYKKRHVVENLFGRLKDRLGVAFRRCRCAYTYQGFVAIALIFLFF